MTTTTFFILRKLGFVQLLNYIIPLSELVQNNFKTFELVPICSITQILTSLNQIQNQQNCPNIQFKTIIHTNKIHQNSKFHSQNKVNHQHAKH